jgi:outer membrane protein assembly factor BamE (lipoprotein component of BamABCDE complex)
MASSKARLAAAGIALAFLAACGASGVQVRPDQLTSFKKGETTKADVIAKLGNPTSQTITSDGATMLFYNYAAYQARPASFIPIVGPLVGGADVQTSAVMFQFGPDGRMINYTANNSTIGSATNLASPSTPTTPNQPAAAQ